jgi:putative ABC transport system permease protein
MMLSLRLLARDWRSGELRLLALAVVIAVAAVTGVSWLADRVAGATEARAADLLAADRAVETTDLIPAEWIERAQSRGLSTAQTAVFPTVVVTDRANRLVSAKAVTDGYPLRGRLRTQPALGAPEQPAARIPEPGNVWLESRLLGLLGVEVGDRLRLGARQFRISAIISFEPDRGQGFGSLAPRVMLNHADLASTELLGPGSRARHKLLLAGDLTEATAFTRALRAEQGNRVEIETPSEQGRGAAEIIEQAKRFLGLAALLTVIVAGVAVLLTVRHYAERQITGVAVMRAMGATRRRVLGLFIGKLLWLALFAGGLGAGLGYLMHWGMLLIVADLLGTSLPAAGWPPMRVLRADLGGGLLRAGMPLVVAALVILGLMAWQAGDVRVTLSVFAAVGASLALLAVVAAGVVYGARAYSRKAGQARLLWLSGFTRRPVTAVIQIVAVGVGLMSLFGCLGVETQFYPMVRARLTALNGEPIAADDYDSPQARRLTRREFNLSWTGTLAPDNEIVSGDWWGDEANPRPQLSLETDFAQEIGVAMGDRLTFASGGSEVSAEVTSLRSVRWESFNVNFFVLASPGTFNDLPETWLTSFYLPDNETAVLNTLIREFPSVTPIDVSSVLRIVRTIIDQGSRVVELMSLLTLAAGVLVLLAALQITGEERRFESALLRALGARGRRIRAMARLEFWLVGAIAGALAGLAATAAGMVVAEALFNLAGAGVGLLTVWLAGALGARRYYRASPMRLLREG